MSFLIELQGVRSSLLLRFGPTTLVGDCRQEEGLQDLGVRKDVSTASKNWQDRLAAGMPGAYGPDVADTLIRDGYDLKDINAVIWRHIRSVTARTDGADVREQPPAP